MAKKSSRPGGGGGGDVNAKYDLNLINAKQDDPEVTSKFKIAPEDVDNALKEYERRMVKKDGNTSEIAVIVNKDGTITQRQGGKDYVSFSEDMIARAYIVTHNHPSSNSFSTDDILLSTVARLKEMRATGIDYGSGKNITYRVSGFDGPGSKLWGKTQDQRMKMIERADSKARVTVVTKALTDLEKGQFKTKDGTIIRGLSEKEAGKYYKEVQQMMSHRHFTETSRSLGLKYSREEI